MLKQDATHQELGTFIVDLLGLLGVTTKSRVTVEENVTYPRQKSMMEVIYVMIDSAEEKHRRI